MDLGLMGRRKVVTGAGSGIRFAVTNGLVAEGARVVAAEHDPPAVSELGESIGHRSSPWGDPSGGVR